MSRPIPVPVHADRIPDEFKHERRWLLWRYVQQGDRFGKLPFQSSGRAAKSNDATTWTTFAAALAAYRAGDFDGLGFVLGDGWAGIDLDHCIDGTRVKPTAIGVISMLDDVCVYQEVSPSGTGYKAIGRCARIGGQIDFATDPPTYTTWSGARYFTVTGCEPAYIDAGMSPTADLTAVIDAWFPTSSHQAASEVPSYFNIGDTRGKENITAADVWQPLTDDELIERVLASPQAEKFTRLVRGDIADYGNDRSRADQALASILAYWCRGNVDQIDRLFRQSGLMRPKWDVPSYRRATLAKAVRQWI